MAYISWIKLQISTFDDEKIKLIEKRKDADTVLIVFLKMLLLAGKTDDGGFIYLGDNIAYNNDMLETILNRPAATVEKAIKVLTGFGMLAIDSEGFHSVVNWDKYQNFSTIEKVRANTRERVKKFRDKKKTEHEEEITDEIQGIWIKSWGRNPKLPEVEKTQELLEKFGAKKTLDIMKKSQLMGFKKVQTLIDALDDNGEIKPKDNNNGNTQKSKASVSNRVDHKVDKDKYRERGAALKKQFGED